MVMRGPSLTMVEATSVTPEGRITPEDSGLWKDTQIEPLRRIVEFAHSQGQHMGIQLAHAGRKASTIAPWLNSRGSVADEHVGGWPSRVLGPSDLPYDKNHARPTAMTKADIRDFKDAWVAAVKRALTAGFDVIEIHNAHGYLLHNFVSPTSNERTDEYGGSFENRIRLTLEIVDLTRATVPKDMPVFLRISATDWLEEIDGMQGWTVEDTVVLGKMLVGRGVDLIDVSSGGNHPKQKIKTGPGYQVRFSRPVILTILAFCITCQSIPFSLDKFLLAAPLSLTNDKNPSLLTLTSPSLPSPSASSKPSATPCLSAPSAPSPPENKPTTCSNKRTSTSPSRAACSKNTPTWSGPGLKS
jgi:2,4-dienoyl-CoA reductase-like NADH-dependent reductase (Old Yellow Enzyme family)